LYTKFRIMVSEREGGEGSTSGGWGSSTSLIRFKLFSWRRRSLEFKLESECNSWLDTVK
jgi:hypothetical protein